MNIKKIAKNINILCDNMVDEVAIINMLNAKLMHLISFKGIKFQSIENLERPMPPSYYAFNFVPSGGVKNKLLMEIGRLTPFYMDIINAYNEERYKQLELKQEQELYGLSGAEEKALRKEHHLERRAFKELYWTVGDATQASIYNSMDIIANSGYGSAYLENTEFANYFEDAFLNRDKNKKEFLDMLFNLWDGEFVGTNTMTTARKNIKGVSVSAGFMSDYKLILENGNLTRTFKSYLIRGMARRSWFYFSDKLNFYQKEHKMSTYEEKQQAIKELSEASQEIKEIYDKIKLKGEYVFNKETNDYINNYKIQINKKVKEFYKDTEYLDEDSEILKLTIQHSTWKIIKLAVLYHLLDNPQSSLIKLDSFRKAESFYDSIFGCLEKMVCKTAISDYDKLYSYLVRHKNKWVSKTELRNQKFVPQKDFSFWVESALLECSEKAMMKGMSIQARVVGHNNRGYEIAMYDTKAYEFRETDKVDMGVKGELYKIDNSDRLVCTI